MSKIELDEQSKRQIQEIATAAISNVIVSATAAIEGIVCAAASKISEQTMSYSEPEMPPTGNCTSEHVVKAFKAAERVAEKR